MKKKLVVIIAVVAAVMVLGVGSALAFGGPPANDSQTTPYRYRDTLPDTDGDGYGDCDGTCDGMPAAPQDGTGNGYGAQNNVCDDGTCDGVPNPPQDGTGNRYGMQNSVCDSSTCPAVTAGNGSSCDGMRDGSGRQFGRNR